MPNAASHGPCVVYRAIASDALAAASQLLADVQRFGLKIIEFRMVPDVQGGAAIELGIVAKEDCDTAVLRCRFARHPTLSSVEIVEGASSLPIGNAAS
jgi:hypothetical protein